MREHFARSLIGKHHRDYAIERLRVELVSRLDQRDQFGKNLRCFVRLWPGDRDLVAASADGSGLEAVPDLSQIEVLGPNQGRHDFGARNQHRDRIRTRLAQGVSHPGHRNNVKSELIGATSNGSGSSPHATGPA
jgi:hypothetical protein